VVSPSSEDQRCSDLVQYILKKKRKVKEKKHLFPSRNMEHKYNHEAINNPTASTASATASTTIFCMWPAALQRRHEHEEQHN
jgi:hypothetical protein